MLCSSNLTRKAQSKTEQSSAQNPLSQKRAAVIQQELRMAWYAKEIEHRFFLCRRRPLVHVHENTAKIGRSSFYPCAVAPGILRCCLIVIAAVEKGDDSSVTSAKMLPSDLVGGMQNRLDCAHLKSSLWFESQSCPTSRRTRSTYMQFEAYWFQVKPCQWPLPCRHPE
jgi:hypothetical protein